MAADSLAWPLAPGTVLGKYRVVRFLGEGGMGAVYEGLHLEIGKRVALKTISPALAEIPEARARFLLEAKLTSRVRHPHTVDVTDIFMEGSHAFLVMEYLEGEDLAKHIRRCGPLPLDEVVEIVLPILAAVSAAHEEGIIHRDLKPQNIFLSETRDGSLHPKVLDFGISKAPALPLGAPIRSSGVILGSPSYFAPEQVDDPKAISPASDQYALGVILYECVTGLLPYGGTSLAAIFQAILRGDYRPPRAYRADLPEGFEAVIARAMGRTPGDRYADVRQMGRALMEFASAKMRVVWEDYFSAPSPPWAASARAAEAAYRVPVTDQMPGPSRSPLTATVGLADAHLLAIDRAMSHAAPSGLDVPASDATDEPLAVPHRMTPVWWAIGAGALAAAAWLFVAALHGRTHAPAEPLRPPPASSAAARAPAAAPPSERAPRGTTTEPAPAAAAEAAKPADVRTARSGRAAHRLRFGANHSPLIE
jgi:serine/threonine-protein kinase